MRRHATMNRVYRLVWNAVSNAWVAVAENAKGHGKAISGRKRTAAALALTGGALLAPLALAGPIGGQISAGAGSIAQAGANTTITQSSQNLAINWQSFSIAANEALRFDQPNATAIALNRVLGQNPSQILGSLSANGQVFVLNPNGVLFGTGSQVNVGGLVASTLSLSDADFMAGKRTFSNGGTAGAVVNRGALTAAQGGYIALLAPEVRNEGVISATLGTALLAAGDKVTLTLDNGSLLSYSIDQGSLNALAENKQLIQADGGQVFMSAKAANALGTAMVNNTGIIEARSVSTVGGVIRLEGDYVTQLGTLDASGTTGGSIAIHARAILDAGTAQANGTTGSGGNINYTATDAIVQTASVQLTANGATIGGSIHLQGNNSLFSSATLSSTGVQGGTLTVLGNNVILAAASLDASGATQGGLIRVGGDFHGANPHILNAQTTTLNGATLLKADGGKGKVVVWSDRQTNYHGNISAKRAGSIEVSSKGTLIYGGTADAGAGGSLLLDPVNIIISDAGGPAAFALLDPHSAAGNQFGSSTTLLGTTVNGVFTENGKIVIGSPNDGLGGSNAGASYLFDTNTGALLAALTGSRANDQVGDGSTALANGNYVVRSTSWNDRMGAVTWGNGASGISGAVSTSNSLVGTTANDTVGREVIALTNGNYVVESSEWNGSKGAVTWGSGASGISGSVSAGNSLVGTTAGDEVGSDIVTLANGNYVVFSTNWNGNRGAVTWGNGASGISGVVSSGNSLVGTTADDQVGNRGRDFTELTGVNAGNYVVGSPYWNGGMGAVTWWSSGSGGISGEVTASNSLVGTTANSDYVGWGGITALTNGNYVVGSSSWNGGRGAATWGDGATGIRGEVSASNSLIGTNVFDQVGHDGAIALANGNYVVNSRAWNAGRGAVTWGDGVIGIRGEVSASNSLVGTSVNDDVGGFGVIALANGNYVVISPGWDNAGATDAGAVTWGNGASAGVRLVGAVSASNSLVGTNAYDQVGGSISYSGSPTHGGGITELAGVNAGNYVVASPEWNGTKGAVTWGSGTSGVSGAVSAGNSLVGSAEGDYVGGGDRVYDSITALANGNYVVRSIEWNGNRGAVTWGDGANAGVRLVGEVSASNSLIGTNAGDQVGNNSNDGVYELANGNYVVGSSNWNGGMGAATWGNGASGVRGAVSASNSLVGTAVNDEVGENITALANGNYVVISGNWNGGRGAVTWDDGATSGVRLTGAVSAGNSLVGTTAGDQVGGSGNGVTELANGNYVVTSEWNGYRGAVTWGSGVAGGARLIGVVSASNSLVGTVVDDQVGSGDIIALANGNYLVPSPYYAAEAGQVLIGTPFNISFANGTGQNMTFNPSGLTATLAGGTAVTLQASNDITVNSAIAVGGTTGGAFTLQAGRNINLNSTLTTANGNFTAIAGDPGAISADRQPGTPAITLGAGARINAGTGTVTLAANGGDFVNNSGSATPISASRWLVYSTSPAGSTENGLTAAAGSTSPRLYNKTFAGNPPQTIAAGNHLIYSAQPTLTVTADNKTRIYGAVNPSFTSTITGFVVDDGVTDTLTTAGLGGAPVLTTLATVSSTVLGSPHAITPTVGTLASGAGYAFGFVAGSLTISPASVPPESVPATGISPAVVQAITALPGGADLLPAFSSTVAVAATLMDAVAPPPALSNLQYVYVTTTAPGNLSGDIDTTVDGTAVPTKAQGVKSDGFNARLPEAPIQFTGTVLVRNGGINLPSDAGGSK